MIHDKIQQLIDLYGDINDYSLSNYTGDSNPINIRNKITGIVYTQKFISHLNKVACRDINYKAVEYVLKCFEKHSNKYHYTDYIGYNKSVTIVDLENDRSLVLNAQSHFESTTFSCDKLSNYSIFLSKAFPDIYEYMSYDWSKRSVSFRNKETNRVYTQLVHEHLKRI